MDHSPSGTYLAFPDFHTAVLWYNLFGRSMPPLEGGGSAGEPEEANETDDSPQPTENEGETDGESGEDGEEGPGEDQPATDTTGESEDGEADEGNDSDSSPNPDLGGTEEELSEGVWEDYGLTDPTNPEIDPRHRQITKIGDQKEIIQDFASWSDFVACVRDVPQAWAGRGDSRKAGNETFNGTPTWDKAIQMALRTGWPEGRKLLRDLSALVIPRPSIEQSWDFDVAGSHPLVPMYCAGDPACFITDLNAEHRAARPIVRIDLHRNVRWNITTETIITRGAAMLSFAHTLEQLGYSTELRIVQAASAFDGTWTHRANIVFKKAGEVLDLDRAMFAIAHPAAYRRLIFALYEQHAELENDFTHGYGRPLSEPNDPTSNKPGGAIWIPSPTYNGETPETARLAVEKAAQLAGFGDIVPSTTKQAA